MLWCDVKITFQSQRYLFEKPFRWEEFPLQLQSSLTLWQRFHPLQRQFIWETLCILTETHTHTHTHTRQSLVKHQTVTVFYLESTVWFFWHLQLYFTGQLRDVTGDGIEVVSHHHLSVHNFFICLLPVISAGLFFLTTCEKYFFTDYRGLVAVSDFCYISSININNPQLHPSTLGALPHDVSIFRKG